MSDREDDSAARDLLDRVADAFYLWGGGDYTDADRVVVALARHEPILSDRKVLLAINLIERLQPVLGRKEELRCVRAALRELYEGALGMPTEKSGRFRGRIRAEQMEELRVERALLGLSDGRGSVNRFVTE